MSFGLGKRRLAGFGAVVAGALLLGTVGRVGAAEVTENSGATVDQPGAVLIFPKVVYSATAADPALVRDTIIQISNTWNVSALARCFYIDGSVDPNTLLRRWQVTDFSIVLTRQQPTHWVASTGRPVDFSDGLGSPNSGLDPGLIPPVPPGFEGELRCVVVDASENPLPLANWLKGEATIRTQLLDVANYNAIALRAGEFAGDQDNVLLLDQVAKATDGHYSSCPDTLILDFIAYGQDDPVVSEFGACATGCPVETNLTLVPCAANYENLIPGRVSVHIEIFNEFENMISANTTVDCWLDTPLDRIGGGGGPLDNPFTATVLGSPTGVARIRPTTGQGGVLGVAEEIHRDSTGSSGRAAFNLQHEGSRALFLAPENFDRIVLSTP